MSAFRGQRPPPRVRTRPYGSSHRAVAIALAVLGVSIFLAAFVLILDRIRDDDDGGNVAVVATATSTVPSESLAPTTSGGDPSTTNLPGVTPTPPPRPTSELVAPSPSPTNEPVADQATATPEPEEVPTEEPEPPIEEPTEAPEPPAGEFGDLPPALLPSGGVSGTLALTYELGMSLTDLPVSSWVYALEWPIYSIDEVAVSAQNLGLFGDVVEQGVGVYRVDSDSGSLFVSPAEIVFAAAGFDSTGELPDDATAISAAAGWLATSGFTGSNMDGGAVISRDDELGRIVVIFRPVEPAPNLAPSPSATVSIGPGGVVLEARVNWPSSLGAAEYALRPPDELWQLLIEGYGYLDADISGVAADGGLTGTAVITDYSFAFTLAGSPANQQYLVPLVVFLGSATIDQTGDVVPVEIAVPSVNQQAGPLG